MMNRFKRRCRKAKERAVTLLEMLVALMILAAVGTLIVPAFAELTASINHMNAMSYLVQDLKRAQAESITQGCRGVFVIAANGNSYTFGCDYLAYDANDPPSHDVVSLQRFLPAHIRLVASAPVIFNSRGQSVDIFGIVSNSTLALEDASGGPSVQFASGTLLGTGVFDFN